MVSARSREAAKARWTWVTSEVSGLKGKHRAHRVLTVLVNYANEHQECWPTVLTIAYASDVDPDNVRKDLRLLVDLGLIVKDGIHETTGAVRFRLNLDAKRSDTFKAFATKHLGATGHRKTVFRNKAREGIGNGQPDRDGTVAVTVTERSLQPPITTNVTTTSNHQKGTDLPPSSSGLPLAAAEAPPLASGDECIAWTGRINDDGYGTRGVRLAHRAAWEDERGPIPDGLELDHLCHDPAVCKLGAACPHRRCINLDHLEPVTHLENIRRSGVTGLKVTHCPAGHAYAQHGVINAEGRRVCVPCEHEAARRYRRSPAYRAKLAQGCLSRGHERREATGRSGRPYCVTCRTKAATAGAEARWTA
jgi:hypothetical protein